MDQFTLPSFAKINLILHVTGLRRDGYHSLETLFQTIDVHDDLDFHFSPGPRLRIEFDPGDSGLASDETNLIVKALQAFDEIHPIRRSVKVKLRKRIPVGGGLGGGSSNAATTLLATWNHAGRPLDRRQLWSLARRLGADVPFFLYGGTATGRHRGDWIHPLPDLPPIPVFLIVPPVQCSTAEIFHRFDEEGLLTQGRNLIKILRDQRPESLGELVSLIENDLETVVFALYPELDSIKQRLIHAGAVAAALTGSGSAVFGLFARPGDLGNTVRLFPEGISTRFLSRKEYELRLGIRS